MVGWYIGSLVDWSLGRLFDWLINGRVSKYPYQKRSSHFCDPHAPHWAVSSRVWGIRACVPYPETHDRCNYPQTSSQTDSKTVPEQPPNDPRTTPTQPARAPAAGPSVGVVRGSFGDCSRTVLESVWELVCGTRNGTSIMGQTIVASASLMVH